MTFAKNVKNTIRNQGGIKRLQGVTDNSTKGCASLVHFFLSKQKKEKKKMK